jgi:heptaprenyl diphosphate synthase
MEMISLSAKTKEIAFYGIMLAVVLVLSTLETILFANMPFLPPQARPGLANVVIMFCVLCVGKKRAVSLNMLKSVFVVITRGPVAGLLSLCGGLLSVAVIILISSVSKKTSFAQLSVFGAISHNLGQFAAISILLATPLTLYLPFIILFGLATGLLTGGVLKVVLPAITEVKRSK